MKLFAQHGHQPSDKLSLGLRAQFIDGVIFSPKDIAPSTLVEECRSLREGFPNAELFFDPQFYACLSMSRTDSRSGKLLGAGDSYEYKDGRGYFRSLQRRNIEREADARREIERCLQYQSQLPLAGWIAPNIVIRRSLDSQEAAIAKNFVREAGSVRDKLNLTVPIYATLAISTSALLDRREFFAFLDDVTLLETPPDGFYILIAHEDSLQAPSLVEPEVLARWMLLNRSLSVNGFKVLNGFADLLSPYLGIAGGNAAGSGWWQSMKQFSLSRFDPAPRGGGTYVPRYTSTALLKSLRWDEVQSVAPFVPEVWNGLPTDQPFSDANTEDRPKPIHECMQNWEALRMLVSRLVKKDPVEGVRAAMGALMAAKGHFGTISDAALSLRDRSNGDHVEMLRDELNEFLRLAELSEWSQ